MLALAQRTREVISGRGDDPRRADLRSRVWSLLGGEGEKVALFRRLFRGRDDVYALRWENARTGKSGYVPATAGGWTKTGPRTLPAADRRGDRAAPHGPRVDRHLPAARGRHVLVSRLRLRRQDMAARRARAAGGVRRARGACRAGAKPLRRRAATSGSSSLRRSLPAARGGWERCCSERRLPAGRSSTSQATTGSSPTRTSCRRRGSAT